MTSHFEENHVVTLKKRNTSKKEIKKNDLLVGRLLYYVSSFFGCGLPILKERSRRRNKKGNNNSPACVPSFVSQNAVRESRPAPARRIPDDLQRLHRGTRTPKGKKTPMTRGKHSRFKWWGLRRLFDFWPLESGRHGETNHGREQTR